MEDATAPAITLEVLLTSAFRDEYQAWLLVDGVRAAWFSHRVEAGTPKEVFTQTVEVRDGYQGRGVARMIVEEVKKHHGVDEIYHRGGFTPEGYNLRHLFTRPEYAGPPRVEYKSMTFICDWGAGTLHDNRVCICWLEDED